MYSIELSNIQDYDFILSIPLHTHIYELCPEGIKPCNMENTDVYWRRYKIQETLYIGQRHLSFFQSRHLGTSHSCYCYPVVYFPESHRWSEISSLSKLILVFGEARSCRAPYLGCRGSESPEWLDVLPKNSA